jgi:hypothetical protein
MLRTKSEGLGTDISESGCTSSITSLDGEAERSRLKVGTSKKKERRAENEREEKVLWVMLKVLEEEGGWSIRIITHSRNAGT